MTNAVKAEFLQQYKTCEQEAARTKRELNFWRQRAREETPDGGEGPDTAARARYYARMLVTRYRACLGARLLLEDAIIRGPSMREQLLLRLHYVDGCTLEETAEKMDISPRHASRLHQHALEIITVPELRHGPKQAAFEAALTRLAGEAELSEAA